MSDRELDDLRSLVKHPGYLTFLVHVRAEVKNMMGTQLEAVANNTDDALAAGKLRQIIASKKTLEQLFAWPEDRIAALQHKTAVEQQPQTMTRGGV
jgi:hypothetical protein